MTLQRVRSKTMMRFLALLLTTAVLLPVQAQHGHEHVGGRTIQFPDTADYLSLTCDFHMHTVFSDGYVWPSIRVEEAQRDGLDCIAITEHLEYQPHAQDIPHPDRNRAFNLAVSAAGESGLIVIRGSEITPLPAFWTCQFNFHPGRQSSSDRRCRGCLSRSGIARWIYVHQSS